MWLFLELHFPPRLSGSYAPVFVLVSHSNLREVLALYRSTCANTHKILVSVFFLHISTRIVASVPFDLHIVFPAYSTIVLYMAICQKAR